MVVRAILQGCRRHGYLCLAGMMGRTAAGKRGNWDCRTRDRACWQWEKETSCSPCPSSCAWERTWGLRSQGQRQSCLRRALRSCRRGVKAARQRRGAGRGSVRWGDPACPLLATRCCQLAGPEGWHIFLGEK